MNFRSIIFSFSFFLLLGCGVKSDPIPPEGTALPSIVEQYVGKDLDDIKKEEEEKKKKEDKQ